MGYEVDHMQASWYLRATFSRRPFETYFFLELYLARHSFSWATQVRGLPKIRLFIKINPERRAMRTTEQQIRLQSLCRPGGAMQPAPCQCCCMALAACVRCGRTRRVGLQRRNFSDIKTSNDHALLSSGVAQRAVDKCSTWKKGKGAFFSVLSLALIGTHKHT